MSKLQFIIGMMVTVVRKVGKEPGWHNSWSSEMDKFVGKTGMVEEIDISGILVRFPSPYNEDSYYYPPSSLEIVDVEDYIKSIPTVDEVFARMMKGL